MNNEKMGKFISELRKSQQMTQKDLATKLNVTDKSVSKWERGLSCPDIALLTPLSDILGIATSELLNGERNGAQTANVEESIDNALQYAAKAVNTKARSIFHVNTIVFSGLLLLGVITCTIIDIAIAGAFTWSLIPISACVFAWLSLIPTIKYGRKAVAVSFAVFSALTLPFLFVLHNLIDSNGLLLPVGIRASIIGIVYLWVVFALFKILKARKLIATAISLLLLIPLSLLTNFALSELTSTSLFDIWDALTLSIVIVLAIVFFAKDFAIQKRGYK